MANNIDIIQLTKYDGTPFYPLVDINSVAGLSTRLNTIGNNITSLQNGLTSAQGSIATLQGYFDANGKVNYANLPNLYIGNAQVQTSAQTAQAIGGLGTLTPGANYSYNLGDTSLRWNAIYGNSIYADVAFYNHSDGGIYFGQNDDANIYYDGSHLQIIPGLSEEIHFGNGYIAQCTWIGNTIGVSYGGTGKTSWTQNGVVYASASNALAQVANVTGNSQKKFLVQTTNASGTAQAPAWGGIDQRDVLGTSDIGSTSLPVYYKGASNYALAPITDLDLLGQAASHGYVKAKRFYLSSDIYFEWIAPTPTTDGYVKLNAPLLTTGDQIVGSGTPGGGGGGGSIPFLTDLQDVIQGIQPSANKMLIWTSQGTNNAGTTGGWTLIDKSSVGVSTDATQSAHGLMSTADKIKLDSIQFGTQANDYIPITIGSTTENVLTAHQSLAAYATQNWVTQQITNLNLGTAATYSVGSVASGNTGLVTGGAVWSAIDSLPEPMVFKGSLGTGGTITTLPAASSANEGYTYKVITAGTYASKTAKVGDTFISTGSEWVLIPSGDEPNGTVTSVGLTVPTGLSVSGSPITTSGTLAITFASGYSIPTTANQTAWSTASGYFSNGVLPVSHGGTGKDTLTSGSALIGNGTSAVTLRAITNNTVATAVTASTNLITANTLYYHKGNSNIVTVGTITSGTWHGSTIDNDYITNHTITVGSTVFNLGDIKTSLAGLVNVTMTGTLKIGDAEITWDGTNGYLKINKPLLTIGDQIVGSGTPGGGGGGGSIPFLTDLQDVIAGITPTANKMLIWTASGTNNAGTTGGWTLIDKSSVGVTTNASQSAAGLMSSADKIKLDAIEAQANKYVLPIASASVLGGIKVGSGLSINASTGVLDATYTYTLPLAANGTRGGIQIGYSSSGKNYAVQLSSEKAYVNVPWTDTTYKLTLNGTVKGTTSGTDLGSFYAPTSSGTSGHVLISGGANTAPSFRALVANDIPTLPWSKITVSASDIVTKLGNTAVNRADKSAEGTDIEYGFAKSGYTFTSGTIHPFKLYSTQLNNAFYALDKRITISTTGFQSATAGNISKLFDHVYNFGIYLNAGDTGKIIIGSETGAAFTTYTYGNIYLQFYTESTKGTAKSVSIRAYGTKGGVVGWYDYNEAAKVKNTSGNDENNIFYAGNTAIYNIKCWEITIVAHDTLPTYLSELYAIFTRTNGEVDQSVVTKFANAQTLYGKITFNDDVTIKEGLIVSNNKYLYVVDTNGNYRTAIGLSDTNRLYIGYGTTAAGYNTFIDGGNVYIRYGTSHTTGITLASTGAVTIAGATTLSSTLAVTGKSTLTGGAEIPASSTLKIGEATIEWVANSGNGYLKIDKPLLTVGDQIVGSGTPSGGGGGSASYLSDLLDLSETITDKPTGGGYGLVYSTSATDKNGNSGAWIYVAPGTVANISGANTTLRLWSGNVIKSAIEAYGYVTSSGVTSVATGIGLTGGTITESGTIKVKLKNETLNTADSAKSTSTSGGLYSIEADKSGNLAVRVPWVNTWNAASTSQAGYVPKLALASTATIATQSTEYVLTYISGSETAPVWRKLPANAFNNNTYTNGTGISLSGNTFSLNVAGAKTALGLGTMAYEAKADYVLLATAQTISAKHTFSSGILLNTASSWTSSDRAIAFSADGEDANLRYYNTDSNKGLTFNPNTGELKAAKFTRRGGTSSQFLKADGSVDSSSYITGITSSMVTTALGYTPVTNARTVNGKALSSNITLSLDDVDDGSTRKLSNYVPTTRTVNSKALSSNITLTLDDIDNGSTRSLSDYVLKAGDTMSGGLIIEKTGGGLTIRGERLNSNANGGYIYLAGRYYDNDRNGVKIAAEYPGSVGYDVQDLVIYTSYNRSGNASPVWQEAMRIAASGQTFINGQYTYSLYIDNIASGATSAGIRFRTEGTVVGGVFVNTSNDLYFSAGSSSSGVKILTASNYDGYALPLAGGTMTGDIMMTDGEYINASNGYAMLGLDTSGNFYCGSGFNVSGTFLIRSGNINLTHRKFTSSSQKTDYIIWDASNSNLSTVDWAANNLTVAGTSTFSDTMNVENRKYMQWKDSGGTYRNTFGLNNSNSLLIGYGLSSVTGSSTVIYGETVRLQATNNNEIVKTGGATLVMRGTQLNSQVHTILFRGNDSESNGFKIQTTAAGSYGRQSLGFYRSNVTSGSSPYTPVWKRSLYMPYDGGVIIGTSSDACNLTVYGSITSSGDQVISSDATLKTNWKELNYTVKDIANVKIGIFDWKDGHGTSAGSVAQDWKKLIPELVHGDEGNMTLAYGQIALLNTVLLARHEDEQDKEIKELKERIKELENKVKQLTAN